MSCFTFQTKCCIYICYLVTLYYDMAWHLLACMQGYPNKNVPYVWVHSVKIIICNRNMQKLWTWHGSLPTYVIGSHRSQCIPSYRQLYRQHMSSINLPSWKVCCHYLNKGINHQLMFTLISILHVCFRSFCLALDSSLQQCLLTDIMTRYNLMNLMVLSSKLHAEWGNMKKYNQRVRLGLWNRLLKAWM